MPEDEPDYVPPQPGLDAPPADTPPTRTPAEDLAYERGRNEVMAAELERRQTQPAVTAPAALPPEAPLPATPMDMLSAVEREQLRNLRLSDPEAYEAQLSSLGSRHAQMVLARQAAPLIAGNARSIVDSFRARMSYEDTAYFKDVAPLFDAAIAALGNGISGLVTMSAAQQDQELSLRWKSCRADVMEKQQADARRRAKTDPPPLRGDGVNPPAGPTKIYETDPVIASLHARYKFTPEQLEAINGAPV
jgi:hypothetical protein